MLLAFHINFYWSEKATLALMAQIDKGKDHIILIQEPWTVGYKVP